VVLAGFAIAVAMTWPALRHPTRTLPHDLVDPALMGWEARWGAHALLHDPGQLFQGNVFHPEVDSYAFSDTLLGYWPLAIFGHGVAGAILTVNLIYVFACALATIGGYALARQLGASRLGSTVAGLAVAYAPWRLGHVGHLHVISTGGIMLCLAMLARGHGFSIKDGPRPARTRPVWIVAGWLVAAWQMTIGFGIGLVFAYVLAALGVLVLVLWWRRGRPVVRRRVLLANLGGGLMFGAVCVFMALPYLRVIDAHPNARRGILELEYYSPPLNGFLTGPNAALLWRHDVFGLRAALPVPDEMTLLPGITLYLLAGLGVALSVWPRRWRWGLGIGVVVSIVLGMGTNIPPGGWLSYLLLYQLPGWDGLRTPGRLVVWTTLLLALLAAGAVTAVTERLGRTTTAAAGRTPHANGAAVSRLTRSSPLGGRVSAETWRTLLARLRPAAARLRPLASQLRPYRGHAVGVLAIALVLVEGLSVIPHIPVPPAPAALTSAQAATVRPPLLVLPSDQNVDALVMLWSTDGFPQMVNGNSGFTPASQAEIRAGTYSFPDPASVALLRRYGVRTVVVLRDRILGTPWAGAASDTALDGLGITRVDIDDAVVYTLS
jgi:hypothetical protein